MRTSLATIRTAVAVGSAVFAFTATSVLAEVSFDNTPSQQPLYLPYGGVEYGDEYRLAGSEPLIGSFAVQYWAGPAASGTVTVTLYANDGGVDANNPLNPSKAPGTALYTATEAIGTGYNFFGRADLQQFGIAPNGRVTIGLSFAVQGDVGVTLSTNPEAIGSSPDDYWAKTAAGTWGTYGGPLSGGTPYDFTAQINCVPEGSTWLSLAGIFAMAGFGAYRRFRK